MICGADSENDWRLLRIRSSVYSEKRYWRLRRLESAVPAQLALKNVTLRKGRDTLCKVRQSGTCCAEREQPICTASRWQLMESLSGTAVSSTVAIVGSIWPKGPAQAGPAIQAQWLRRVGRECFVRELVLALAAPSLADLACCSSARATLIISHQFNTYSDISSWRDF